MRKLYFGANLSVVKNSLNNLCNSISGKNVTHVYGFPTTVENADNAFSECSVLKYFDGSLSNNLKNMNNMFYNCVDLSQNFDLPSNVINIKGAFYNTNINGKINFPATVKNAEQSFMNTNIEGVHFTCASSSGELNLSEAFSECKNMSIANGTIPNTVKDLYKTFYNSSIIQTPNMQDGGYNNINCVSTFENCINLKSSNFKIPSQSGNIINVFKNCINLEEYTQNVDSKRIIGMFYDCYNLKSDISLYNWSYLDYCFHNCSNIKNINLYPNVESYSSERFTMNNSLYGCSNLKNLNIHKNYINDVIFELNEDESHFHDNIVVSLYDTDWNSTNIARTLYNYFEYTDAYFHMPKHMSVDDYTYSNNSSHIKLTKHISNSSVSSLDRDVIIRNTIRTDIYDKNTEKIVIIEDYCYKDQGVNSITVMSSLDNIMENGFKNIKMCNDVILNFSTGSLKTNMFENSNIINISFCSTNNIPSYMFYNCINLKKVDFYSQNPISIGEYAFYNCRNFSHVVHKWNVNHIANRSFYHCPISDSDINIMKNAYLEEFCLTYYINSLEFNSQSYLQESCLRGVYTINNFKSDKYFNNIFNFSGTVNNVNFYNCRSLSDCSNAGLKNIQYLDFPNLTSVPNDFFNGTNSQYINIPNVTSVGYNAFSWANNLHVTNNHLLNSVSHSKFIIDSNIYFDNRLYNVKFNVQCSNVPLVVLNCNYSYISFVGNDCNIKIIKDGEYYIDGPNCNIGFCNWLSKNSFEDSTWQRNSFKDVYLLDGAEVNQNLFYLKYNLYFTDILNVYYGTNKSKVNFSTGKNMFTNNSTYFQVYAYSNSSGRNVNVANNYNANLEILNEITIPTWLQ